MTHVAILILFSVLVGAFFGLLSRETPREGLKVFAVMTLSMILLSLLVAYLMYPFPLR
jgi:cytochrome bd-type quinol oxidase subunit 2